MISNVFYYICFKNRISISNLHRKFQLIDTKYEFLIPELTVINPNKFKFNRKQQNSFIPKFNKPHFLLKPKTRINDFRAKLCLGHFERFY